MFADKFNITDSLGLKGYVVIKDNKTGEILVQSHNMILKGSKQVLLYKLLFNGENPFITGLDANIGNTLGGKDYSQYSIKKLYLFQSNNEVQYSDDYNSVFSTTGISYEEIEIIGENLSLEYANDENFIFKLKINVVYSLNNDDGETTPSKVVNNLAIGMTDGVEGSTPILFSRIKFDPIIVTPDSDLNFSYYIYF